VKNWQKDAHPEWPDATSATRGLPETERPAEAATSWFRRGMESDDGADAGAGAAAGQAPDADADATDVLPSSAYGRRAGTTDERPAADAPADPTAVLPTAVLPTASGPGGAADAPRGGHGPSGTAPTDVFRPVPAPGHRGRDGDQPAATSGWPKVPRPAATGSDARFRAPGPTASGPAATSLRDPWQESDGALGTGDAGGTGDVDPGEQHDPHEVTVQLDAVQLGDGTLHRAKSGPAADAADRPVFVDESGRRSRLYRRIGIAVGLACAVYAVVILATLLSGSSDAPWLPVPGKEEDTPASKVDTTSQPTESASPSAPDSPTPRTTPSATGVEEQLPDTGATASDTAPATQPSDTATGSESSTTQSAPAQDDDEPETGSTETATDPGTDPPDPTETGDTTPDPTETVGDSAGTGTGTDTLAEREATPTSLAAGAPVSPSPLVENTL
jgi:hypothetical protein